MYNQTFFFDSGPFTGNNDDEVDYEAEQQTQQQEDTSDEESEEDSDSDEDRYALTKAAWVDDDDKKLQISLKAANMTKKLRNDIDEDVIDGAEYTRRLRRQ